MTQQLEYDVFISYSHEDKTQANHLANKLKNEYSLNVWLDKWKLIAGKPFSDGMEKGLKESKSCIVVIGSDSQEGWFRKEIQVALDRQAEDPSFGVISVILPGVKPTFISGFLKSLTWVTFDENLDEKRPLHELYCGIKNVPPGDKHLNPSDQRTTPNLKPTDGFPKELTLNFPKLRLDQVIGRSEDIEDLRKRLFDNKQVVLVNGMGGIGKTTVAEVYVTQNFGYYKHIAWVSLLTDDFSNDLINSRGLLANLNIDKQDKSLDQLFEELLLALKNIPEGPCLMVIDNASSNLSKFYKLLPGQPKWHILVTSRERIAPFDVKELGFLSEPEAVALFKKYYKRGKINDDAIKEIVKTLEYHTLTIEILAKTAQHQNKSPEAINKAVEEDMEADINVNHSSEKIEKITSYLCSIFKLSELDEDEKWLLTQFACLPPEFHKEELLRELIEPDEVKESKVAKLLSNLVKNGWLLYDSINESYKLHRILSDVIGASLTIGVDTVAPLIYNITSKLDLDQTKDNPVDKFEWVPYGKAILNQFKTNISKMISDLQSNLASGLQDLGEYKEAKKLLKKTVASYEKKFGKEHPETARSYSNLGLVLKDLGEYKEAKKLLEKTVASYEKKFGKEHPETAIGYSNLGLVLKDLGEYKEAKKLLEKAVASDEKNFGKEHPTTARSYSNLGLVLQILGEYKEAKKLLEKVVASDEKNFEKEHPTTAIHYSILGIVLQDLGEYKEAKKLLEKAVSIFEKNFGKEHPATARGYSNLATVLQDLSEHKGAKKLLEKAMASDEKKFGKNHPTTAIRYSNLALVLKDLGDYSRSKELLEKALNIFEKSLGMNHPNTITVRENLEYIIEEMNNS